MEPRQKLGTDQLPDPAPRARPVPLQIIATTEEGTRAALMEARHLLRRLSVSGTVLLVPRISSTASIEGPEKDAEIAEGYRRLANETGVDIKVRLFVANRYSDAIQWMLPSHSTVVVGGRRRWWWPTREQRIADQMKRAGHVIVFANASGSDSARR